MKKIVYIIAIVASLSASLTTDLFADKIFGTEKALAANGVTITLEAVPNSGAAPLNNVSLKVTIRQFSFSDRVQPSNQLYYLAFYCKSPYVVPAKVLYYSTSNPIIVSNICSYNSAGTYRPYVFGMMMDKRPFGVATSVTVSPSCAPLPTQYRNVDCPSGQSGTIRQQRVSTCPGPAWGAWTTISNTCTAGPVANISFTQDTRPESVWPPGFREFRSMTSVTD